MILSSLLHKYLILLPHGSPSSCNPTPRIHMPFLSTFTPMYKYSRQVNAEISHRLTRLLICLFLQWSLNMWVCRGWLLDRGTTGMFWTLALAPVFRVKGRRLVSPGLFTLLATMFTSWALFALYSFKLLMKFSWVYISCMCVWYRRESGE